MVNIYQKVFLKRYPYKILTLKTGKVFYEILQKYFAVNCDSGHLSPRHARLRNMKM
tara:strand:- start:201 stop:368 length:168 start_codon:yes stop_codon:yes gene_type:complete